MEQDHERIRSQAQRRHTTNIPDLFADVEVVINIPQQEAHSKQH